MHIDHLSPVAPARIRVLVLPVGRIRRSRFQDFFRCLGACTTVPLSAVSPDSRPDRHTFSPQTFPEGVVLYDFVTSVPSQSHLELSPFELFREPLVILGLGDATEYSQDAPSSDKTGSDTETRPSSVGRYDPILAAESDIRTKYENAIVHKILLFDCEDDNLPQDVKDCAFPIAPISVDTLPGAALLPAIKQLTSTVLADMTDLVKKFRSKTSVAQISPTYFINNPNGASSQRLDVPPQNLSSGYRLSMPVIINPAADRLDNLKAASSKLFSDRPLSIAGFSGSFFKSRSSSAKTPSSAPSVSGDAEKNRIDMLVGTLYLQAGSWSSAIRDLSESTLRAKQNGDMLWYCKGLENTLACLILLIWAGVDFDLPQVILDKDPDKKRTASKPAEDATVKLGASEESKQETARTLASILPTIVTFVINTYAEFLSIGKITPLGFAESSIRLCKLSAVLFLCNGNLTKDAISYLVTGTRIQLSGPLIRPSIRPSRQEICNTLMNSISSQLSPVDYVMVLSGIATVLSLLEMHRKRAFILQELVACLVPYLIQARKVGAAELGLHPAVGLATLATAERTSSGASALQLADSETEQSISNFLAWINSIYGIPSPANTSTHLSVLEDVSGTSDMGKPPLFSAESFAADAQVAAFGGLSLKRGILKACINVCEALPDFQGALDFISLLLRVLNPRFAASIDPTLVAARAAREEQGHLWSTLIQTFESAKSLGLHDVSTEYWDIFLVRNIRVPEGPDHLALNAVEYSTLLANASDSSPRGAIFHNPWRKKPAGDQNSNRMVKGEAKEFLVTLQNPYNIDIEIESISLATTGVKFKGWKKGGVLPRRETQDWLLTGMALEAGEVTIIGCSVKVKACRERVFPIFSQGWNPYPGLKVKEMGISALPKLDANANQSLTTENRALANLPVATTLSLEAIPELPVLAVTRISCPQSAIMILEGQRTTFSITLRNMSDTVPVNRILTSFSDTVQEMIQSELAIPNLPMPDVFELEHQIAVRPAMGLLDQKSDPLMSIGPGEERTFEFFVLGKAGLTEVNIKFSYTHVPSNDEGEKDGKKSVFMRHVNVPVAVTVNSSLQIPRVDIVSLPAGNPWIKDSKSSVFYVPDLPEFQPGPGFEKWLETSGNHDYCLFNVDFRNTWPVPLTVTVKMLDWEPAKPGRQYPLPLSEYQKPDSEVVYSLSQTIQPGHVARVPFTIPRFYLAHQHDPIRHLIPENEKQFTVSRLSISPYLERISRENFWYRDELLHLIRAEWREIDAPGTDGRVGEVDLRSVRLTKPMVNVLSLDSVQISMWLSDESALMDRLSITDPKGEGGQDVKGKSDATDTEDEPDGDDDEYTGDASTLVSSLPAIPQTSAILKLDDLNVLTVCVHNRTGSPISGILRIQPRLRVRRAGGGAGPSGGGVFATLPIAFDLTRRLTYSGVLQHELVEIPHGRGRAVEIGLCALGFGQFEVGASFDKIHIPDRARKRKGKGGEEGEGEGEGKGGGGGDDDDGGDRSSKLYTAPGRLDVMQLLSLGEERKRTWTMDRPFRISVRGPDRGSDEGFFSGDDGQDDGGEDE